ncbi:MAG: hypothetical protein DRN91_02625 [Candidatus Alkanophagales archaeon]|nr:MAG: hypothetical protein DRN91_02625 [Candidatus Alkanophagales archaeon]
MESLAAGKYLKCRSCKTIVSTRSLRRKRINPSRKRLASFGAFPEPFLKVKEKYKRTKGVWLFG